MKPLPPRLRALAPALLAVLVIAGSAAGVLIWQLTQKEKPASDGSGFDLSQTRESRGPAAGTAAGSLAAPAPSGLGLLQHGDWGELFGEDGGSSPGAVPKAAASFTEAVRNSEPEVRVMAKTYTQRYPLLVQYGKDWMSYPDLKKLNDDYMTDHDPIKFLHGLAESQNFGKLVAKYARDPVFQTFVKESVTKAPKEMVAAATALLQEDGIVKGVVTNTASAMGLPPALTAGIFSGGKIDEKAVLGQVMQANPELQKAAQDPNVRTALPQQQGR